jgi:O-glycosyl hydrolase
VQLDPINTASITVDCRRRRQTIDGFGVNINSKYWNGGKIEPIIEMLIDDLGATIFRQDVYGRSDWVDPSSRFNSSVLSEENLARIYASPEFIAGAGMGKYLNSRGINPYMTVSGIIPKWMCAKDGATLTDYKSFARMIGSFALWARKKAGIKYSLLGPMNETDIGPPEGPKADPKTYVKACEALVTELDRLGLKDLKLVVAEQAHYDLEYIKAFGKSRKLAGRIGAFGMHNYGGARMHDAVALAGKGIHKKARVWMTEYGDLEQTGEREWFVAWMTFKRLLQLLEDGMNGAMNWDAFDNYHDHDESWSIYGLIRWGIRTYTPKKRFYACKHIYRYTRPGWVRVGVESAPGLPSVAFVSPDGKNVTVAGMNDTGKDLMLDITVTGDDGAFRKSQFDIYRTTESDSCSRIARMKPDLRNWPPYHARFIVPAESIFTVTN